MGKVRTTFATASVLALVGVGGAYADDPEIADRPGDANLINNHGLPADPNAGPATTPASVAGADIRSIAFDTTYTTSKVRRADGSVARVDHTATGLKVTVTMEGDILPTPGPSLGVVIPTTVNGCEAHLQAFWRGPAALPNDPQRAALRKTQTACGGDTTLSAGFSLAIQGNVATLTYPFSAPAFSGTHDDFLADGVEMTAPPVYLNSQNNPWTTTAQYVQAGSGWVHAYATPIDMAPQFQYYLIGQDVPEDIDCTLTPDHAECAA